MTKRFIMVLTILILIFCFLSCEQLQTSDQEISGLSELDKIPAEYGKLVSVTTDTKYPGWSQMWFADDMGVIRMIRVNWYDKTILDDVVIISRDVPVTEEL